jgi:hypothetical protein
MTFVTPDPNAPFDPVALAQAVYGAASDASRQQAIVNALAAIDIGMYTAEGDPIFSGAERTSTDFMVYDFEIAALSGGMADEDEYWLGDLAETLSTMNVAGGDAAFSAADFASAVATATAASMSAPDNQTGRALRLARELGMLRSAPVDLAAAPGLDPIVLDPLAAFLVAADYSLPRILAAEPPPVAGVAQIASIGGVAGLTAADPCARFTSRIGSNWYAGATQLGNTAGNASMSRSLQAQLAGGTVKMGKSSEPSWHHRHKGGQLQVKNYFIGLQVRVQVPPRVNCGPIRYNNGQVQGGGAVVGADVSWTYPNLDHHADITCDNSTCRKTDASGTAQLHAAPKEEPGPGGIGPELTETVRVTAEVNLVRALGQDLYNVLNLPPDMRVLARKTMPTDVSWHHGYDVQVLLDSRLWVTKAAGPEFANDVGTAFAQGTLDVKTVHPADQLAPAERPAIAIMSTRVTQGAGPFCTPGFGGAKGSVIVDSSTNTIDFQVVDAVIYPPEDVFLYVDVGPADDYTDDTYKERLCKPDGGVVSLQTGKGVNLWEGVIFQGYPSGLSFKGLGVWQYTATQQDWEGTRQFKVAEADIPQTCGGHCTDAKDGTPQSWLKLAIFAQQIPDP